MGRVNPEISAVHEFEKGPRAVVDRDVYANKHACNCQDYLPPIIWSLRKVYVGMRPFSVPFGVALTKWLFFHKC